MATATILVDTHEVTAYAIKLDKTGVEARTAAAGIVRTYTELTRTQIMANAQTGFHLPGEGHIPGTGPGPNVATGDYLRSWEVNFDMSADVLIGLVGTNAPQARRLEFGWYEAADVRTRKPSGRLADRGGRRGFQPPYPHIEPAIRRIEPMYVAAFEAMAVTLL